MKCLNIGIWQKQGYLRYNSPLQDQQWGLYTTVTFNESQSSGDVQCMLQRLSTKPAGPQAAMLTKEAKLN